MRKTHVTMCILLAAILTLCMSGFASADAAPYMVATVLGSSGARYDVLEGRFMCVELADNTYYCMHNWYDSNGTYDGTVDGSGYAGFQYKDGMTWTILSIWDTANGRAAIEYAPEGSVAEPFGGEGSGQHVLVPYYWEVNHWYTMRIQVRTENGKSYYYQYVKPEGGTWDLIAVISFSKPDQAFSWDCFFLEDWMSNNLSRGCQLKEYYARNADTNTWQSLSTYYITNSGNIDHNCMYQTVNNEAVMIQSGGDQVKWVQIPYTLTISQYDYPDEPYTLYPSADKFPTGQPEIVLPTVVPQSHDDAWYCSNCGTLNYYNFCTECGAKKPDNKCPQCGTEYDPNNMPNYCPNCGYKLNNTGYSGVLYGLAIDKVSTRSGPSTKYNDTGTFDVKGQYIKVLSRAWDDVNEIWWVKCEIPDGITTRVLWTGYKRFDSSTLPLNEIPLENSIG